MSKKYKVLIPSLVIVAVFLVGIGCAVGSFFKNVGKEAAAYANFDYSSLDLSNTADGTYTGSEDGDIVKASVEVTVKDHAITKIALISHENGKGQRAEVIVDDIVKANSLEVDAISGATYSSGVIKVAVYNALMP